MRVHNRGANRTCISSETSEIATNLEIGQTGPNFTEGQINEYIDKKTAHDMSISSLFL